MSTYYYLLRGDLLLLRLNLGEGLLRGRSQSRGPRLLSGLVRTSSWAENKGLAFFCTGTGFPRNFSNKISKLLHDQIENFYD